MDGVREKQERWGEGSREGGTEVGSCWQTYLSLSQRRDSRAWKVFSLFYLHMPNVTSAVHSSVCLSDRVTDWLTDCMFSFRFILHGCLYIPQSPRQVFDGGGIKQSLCEDFYFTHMLHISNHRSRNILHSLITKLKTRTILTQIEKNKVKNIICAV